MIVVSDTSPISNLLLIGEIDLLRLTFSKVLVPRAVYLELCEVESNRRALSDLDWIEERRLAEESISAQLLHELDRGEAEAIALALQVGADYLLIDESLGRMRAKDFGLTITGLLGVLLRAKADGSIERIKPYIDRLTSEARFRLSAELITDTLRQADEL